MYIEASSPHQPGDDAKFYSPPLKFFGVMCLEFYYYMSGAANGSLNVSINETVVFSASGDTGNIIWLKASINISSIVGLHWVSHQNRLETVRGGGYFRNFWVGMCHWDPGTLNLYQS